MLSFKKEQEYCSVRGGSPCVSAAKCMGDVSGEFTTKSNKKAK